MICSSRTYLVLSRARLVHGNIHIRNFSGSLPRNDAIGFIGLGNMGAHMAHNLLKAGHQVTVFDLNKKAVELATSRGAKVASSPKDVASASDVVVTMLPSSPHVKEVYSSGTGILAGVRPRALLIDASTIDPSVAREVQAAASSRGATMVDAPVSGGVGGAEAGTLTFMVGGSEDAFERAKPYLTKMGKNVVHCGGSGNGQVAKICNNLVLGISMIGVCEAMNLGVKFGMDPKKLAGIFNTSSARCWSSDTYNPVPGVMPSVPSSRGYEGGFGVDLMLKDLGLANQAAESESIQLPLGKEAKEFYKKMSDEGLGKKDFSVPYDYLSKH